jgi:hypothetical protein
VRLEIPSSAQDIADFVLLDLAPGSFVTRDHAGEPYVLNGRCIWVASDVVEEGCG